jgi:CDP-paratose 2-epimerase
MLKKEYSLIGYKGKQVRDNLHSADLINCFWEFYKKPKKGEIYNIGGGRYSNCSILEALNIVEKECKISIRKKFIKLPRVGDHIWYVSNTSKFKKDYPKWKQKYNTKKIIKELIENN